MSEVDYKQKFDELQALYENNGTAKLYYSLNRKMNEMADIMNKNNLTKLALDDPKDKTFDRLKIVWQGASEIALSVKALGEIAGITGNEDRDVSRKPFVNTIADSR